jgi:hypothetical protein
MAADLNYLSSEHPLHSERTTASGKMFGDFANGSVAVYSGYPGQEFLRKPRFFYRSVEQSAQQSIDFPSCRVGCEFHPITITISIARREAAESFPIPRRPPLAHYRGARRMRPDQLLVACPKCRAWPCPSMPGGHRDAGRRKRVLRAGRGKDWKRGTNPGRGFRGGRHVRSPA